MIKIHHLNNSRSHRVLWLLEELNAEYMEFKKLNSTMESMTYIDHPGKISCQNIMFKYVLGTFSFYR